MTSNIPSNNDLILKITREFEKVVAKIINSKYTETYFSRLKSERLENKKTIDYHKEHLIGKEELLKIKEKLNEELITELNTFSGKLNSDDGTSVQFEDILNII